MGNLSKRSIAGLMLMAVIVPVLAACGGQSAPAAQEPIVETVVVVQTAEPQVVEQTVVVAATADPNAPADTAAESFTTPHPILGDVKVRQAIAHCTNRPELIASVYPYLDEEQQQGLLMDTFLPKTHWAANNDSITTYPFDVEAGAALLEEAGWTLAEGDTVRANADGEPLSLSFTTTNAQFRQTWSAVFIQQMAACGIEIIPTYAPGSWWFGSSTGLQRRDFELGAYAWVGEADPSVDTLYSCNQIPVPSNNWEGQNYMGWCNETASRAIIAASNSLDREQRIGFFATAQEEFTKDMVSLPLFNRSEAYAASNNLTNFKPDPTEYYTANADEWELTEGDTVVLGFTQEPASMWGIIESAAVQRQAANLISIAGATTYGYEYQAKDLTQVPTIENGGATNEDVEVSAGDIVWNTDGEAVELAEGVEVVNSEGETVTWDGSSPLTMKQLSVTFDWAEGITWEDGEPLKQADFELGARINCDPEAGVTTLTLCESRKEILFEDDNTHTVVYHPGVQWAEYSIYTIGAYPSHQVLADGRTLADVPAAEWETIPEIVEDPLSTGPYVLESWEKGQSMTFTANPNYYKGAPAIQTVIIKFIADTNQAVAQLLTGEVDALDSTTLGGGAEIQTVLDAAAAGDIQAYTVASPTWEHIDFNLFVK